MAKLNSMVYKTFTWVNNPGTCSYSCDRIVVEHKYPEADGVDLEDLGINKIIVSGSGAFFGPDAYSKWNELETIFKDRSPGYFYHPVYTNISRGLMTKLQSGLESRENYISYTFEIAASTPSGDGYTIIEALVQSSGGSGGGSGDIS